MELPDFIASRAQEIAKEALIGKKTLPSIIPGSAQFYVAEEDDLSIVAFGGFTLEGKTFKIGTKN